ncbi:MAG: chorismate synthase [Clostridia bacterium]|nr:chorismate synthase [Clostridia bacterium]
MATHYGQNIDVEIYGGSHEERIGVIIKGLPIGFKIDEEKLLAFLSRRAPGNNEFSTPRKEADLPVFLEGVTDGVITENTVHAVVYNKNQRSKDYQKDSFIPRPSHADFAARMKYGKDVDLRGGGHFSGRLTAPMCIAGGICLQILEQKGIHIGAQLYSVGNALGKAFDSINVSKSDFDAIHGKDFPTLSNESAELMKAEILSAKQDGDSIGAIIECAAIGLPIGLGEHMFSGVENRISSIVFGIPAVKGIEFGNGFECAKLRGSKNNDAFYTDGEKVFTKTNNAGGILGGMTSGMPLIFRAAMKPTPSIFIEQDSVDLDSMTNTKLKINGRHDPCVAVRAVPVFEAAAAIAIFDMLCD